MITTRQAFRLNGWQRLWVLLLIIWTAMFVAASFALGGETTIWRNVVMLWALPPVGLYAVGYGIAWVRRGF